MLFYLFFIGKKSFFFHAEREIEKLSSLPMRGVRCRIPSLPPTVTLIKILQIRFNIENFISFERYQFLQIKIAIFVFLTKDSKTISKNHDVLTKKIHHRSLKRTYEKKTFTFFNNYCQRKKRKKKINKIQKYYYFYTIYDAKVKESTKS